MNYIADRKENKSYKLFDTIAPTYRCINTVLSMGLDRYWRKKLLNSIQVEGKALDIACGTGDLSLKLAQRRTIDKVTGIDLSTKMLEVGNKRSHPKVELMVGDGEELQFPDNHFDLVTISFGIRNFSNLSLSLEQIYRVLKPGGQLLILEFSMPKLTVIKWLYLCYLRCIVPLIGGLLSCNLKAYHYLNRTIENFPSGTEFLSFMDKANLKETSEMRLSWGITTLYQGRKR